MLGIPDMAFFKRELFSNLLKIRFLTKFIFFPSLVLTPFIIYFYHPPAGLSSDPFRGSALGYPAGPLLIPFNEFSYERECISTGQFCYYLAGLFEGDGYITVYTNTTKRQRNPVFAITFNLKDKPLAIKILSFFNLGHISNRKSNSVEMRITSVKDLILLVHFINGKLRTPKIDQLYNLIDWLNHNHSCSIVKLPLDNSPLSSNAWLSGFFDADSCFYIGISPSKTICKFTRLAEQRIIYPSPRANGAGRTQTNQSLDRPVAPLIVATGQENSLLQITSFFKVKLYTRYRISIDKHYFIIRIESQHPSQLLVNYLDKFSLFSSKYLDFLSWKRALSLIINKNHKTDKGQKIIANLKNNMNNKRTKFNWDHLNNLVNPLYAPPSAPSKVSS